MATAKKGTLASRWREAREALGQRVNAFDRAAGLTTGFSSRIENGGKESPRADMLLKAARAMGVRPEWLLDGEEPRRPAVAHGPDPTIAELTTAIATRPGLAAALAEGGARWRVSSVVQVVTTEFDSLDGTPPGGWPDALDRAERGASPIVSGADAASAIERAQGVPTLKG